MSPSTLSAQSVTVQLGGQRIIDDISLSVAPGEVVALIGPNGAGKSTLLRALSGEHPLASGSVCLDDQPIDQWPLVELARRRSVMTQGSAIAFDFRVEEILAMGWVNDSVLQSETLEPARQDAIDRADIGHLLGRRIRGLSGGELQRLHFARALLQIWPAASAEEPHYLLLDEPTAALDMRHELALMRELTRAAARCAGVLVVVHDLNLAARFANRVALLRSGRLAHLGSVEETLSGERLTEVYQTPIDVAYDKKIERLQVRAL